MIRVPDGGIAKVGWALRIVGLAFTVGSFFGPWWFLSAEASPPAPSGVSAYDWTFGIFGGSQTTTTSTSSATTTWDYPPDVRNVFQLGLIVGVVLGVLALVLAMVQGARPRLGRFAVVMAVLASLFVLLALLYFMSSIPGSSERFTIMPGTSEETRATVTGFWGTTTSTANYFGGAVTWTWMWGAGWGWYLAVAGGVLVSGALLVSRALPRKT